MPTINDLRRHLFDTLEGLRDEKNPMDIARAEAIAKVAQTIVNRGGLSAITLRSLAALVPAL